MVWLHRKPGKLHTVGRPVGYRRVTVRDEAGRMLPPGRTGEVVIELPMWDRADGYLDAPPELARRFENGALWTGDRGKIDRHGFLVLTSRNAEILKVGGRSVAALRIEEAIAALPEVAEVVVVGVPDRLLGEVPCAVFVPAGGGRRLEEDGPDLIDVRPDEQPRWFLARRDLPRGPSGKIRRGQLAQEAARWTRWFDQAIVPDHRLYPAHAPVEGVAVVDGCPAEWKGDGGALDPAARIVTLVEREPLRPLALAIVQAGATGVGGEVRFIVGPHPIASAAGRATADVLDLFAAELVALTGRLPGPRPELTCAFAAEHVRAYAGAGFVAVPQRAGWMTRAERSAEDAHGPIGAAPGVVLEAALDEVAAAWPRLAR
jgi:hypothetical protein